MNRREFIALIAGAAATWPISVQGQSSPGTIKRPLIGALVLDASEDDSVLFKFYLDALNRLGYVDGKNATIVVRYAGGKPQALPALAAELARLKPDVIMADVSSAIKAVRSAAPDVPIVGASMSYPIEQGLIASFSHPGGNLTGMAGQIDGINSKLIDLALKAVAGVRRIGLLINPEGANVAFERNAFEGAAQQRGIGLEIAEARAPGEIESAVDALAKGGAAIIITQANGLFITERRRIAQLALAKHMPVIATSTQIVETGYLLTYGTDRAKIYPRAAVFVDKILKGAKPGDLPVEFPTKLDLTVNLKTAKALGIEVPQAMLLLADKVIE
jgi:putative ABC transport system substrate-binding protein